MKKKLMISMVTTLVFTLIIVTILFVVIENYEYIQNIKQNLKVNNQIIINVIKNNNDEYNSTLFTKSFNNDDIRETLIDKNGKVISDTVAKASSMENHNERYEVIEARKYGTGYSIRNSKTIGTKTLYFATAFDNGYVLRSAMTTQIIKGLESNYLKYYIMIVLLSVVVSIIFALKLSSGIVRPLKDLEVTTDRIATGRLDERVNIVTDDEIGQLGITFNNMAEKLQKTIEDAFDKQNKLEAILKSMDSGVIAVDKNLNIIMINPYAKEIFGIDNDIIGKKLLYNIRDFEFESILKEGSDEYKEIKILSPKERELRIKTADIINTSREKIGVVAVVQDVTDIKKLENMRSQFVANVSHELKTPLTSIKGFAETLRYVDDKLNKEKFLDIIDDEVNRLTRLIDDILTLSHIENDREEKNEKIDVNDIITDVFNLVRNLASKKNIKLEFIRDKRQILYGDKDRFKQMIINLVDNAIKYSNNGAEVSVTTKTVNGNCVIEVKDTGVGIPEEHIGSLFERFYRVDKARSRKQGGTGLGLAIVKHIIISFNGNIKVESKPGKGSKFIISIPLK
ncbi:sensor histidine kinase [Clostridium fermenticellae]|uniref:histidine kinase n=1 Tax=Clostridium fermenticellae TaxID=2068654 RepID=A0A386H2U7_9CLOT|nr:HAMP domain-containing sensor histidine kinase [Clostridium fermenticellae]AYD39996.1 sensor histidine kinase [Clostridium fermenticellae]